MRRLGMTSLACWCPRATSVRATGSSWNASGGGWPSGTGSFRTRSVASNARRPALPPSPAAEHPTGRGRRVSRPGRSLPHPAVPTPTAPCPPLSRPALPKSEAGAPNHGSHHGLRKRGHTSTGQVAGKATSLSPASAASGMQALFCFLLLLLHDVRSITRAVAALAGPPGTRPRGLGGVRFCTDPDRCGPKVSLSVYAGRGLRRRGGMAQRPRLIPPA